MDARDFNFEDEYVEKSTDWELCCRNMCHYYISLIEGDTHLIDKAYALMKSLSIVNEDGFEL